MLRLVAWCVIAFVLTSACRKKGADPEEGPEPEQGPEPTVAIRDAGPSNNPPPATGAPNAAVLADLNTLPGIPPGGKASPQSELASDGTNLYAMVYASGSKGAVAVLFVRIPFATGVPHVLATWPDYHMVRDLEVGNQMLHWTTADGIGSMPIGGGPITETKIGMHWRLRYDDGWFYTCSERALERVAVSTGKPEVLVKPTSCNRIFVRGDTVVWLDLSSRPRRVLRVQRTGGEPDVLVADNRLSGLSVSGDRIYYLLESTVLAAHHHYEELDSDATILSLPLSGKAEPTKVVTNLKGPEWLASDEHHVYWGRVLSRAKVDGTDVRQVAIWPENVYRQHPMEPPVIHDGKIYWLDRGDGKVYIVTP